MYSHLSNNRGGRAKVTKSINVEVGIKVEGGIFWKKPVHKCNKRGVEGGKIYEINPRGGWIIFVEGGMFSKSVSLTSRLLERSQKHLQAFVYMLHIH